MTKINRIIEEAYAEELYRLSPVSVDTVLIKERTFEKLGLSSESSYSSIKEGPSGFFKETSLPAVRKRRLPFALAVTGLAAAACILLAIGINFINPQFTENLPVLGGIFQATNNREKPPLPPTPSQASMDPWKESYFNCNIRSAYLEDDLLHISIQGKTNMDLTSDTIMWNCRLIINGEEIGENRSEVLESLSSWNLSEDNICYNDNIAIRLPESACQSLKDNPDQKQFLNLVLTDTNNGEKIEFAFDLAFTPTISYESAIDVSQAEQNGIKVTSLIINTPTAQSTSSIKATVDVGQEYAQNEKSSVNARLEMYREDGARVYMPSGAFPEPSILSYDFAPDPQDNLLVLRVMLRDTQGSLVEPGQLLAEFTLDLAEGTCLPSQKYLDADSSLFWNSELLEQDLWVYPYYRASDQELADLKEGYIVEYLSRSLDYAPYGGTFLINLATTEEFRNLMVNIVDENEELLAVGRTSLTELWSSKDGATGELATFQPFSQYSIDDLDFSIKTPELYEEIGKEFFTGSDPSRDIDLPGVSIQTVRLDQAGLMSLGTKPLDVGTYTVNVYDEESQENVLSQKIQLILPEDAPLEQNQRLVRMCAETYPYVPITDVE